MRCPGQDIGSGAGYPSPDEPFSALDYQTRLSVCDDISTIIRGRHKTAILITNDLSEAIVSGGSGLSFFQREAGKDQRNTAHPIFHTGFKLA